MGAEVGTITAEVVQVADNAYAYIQDDRTWFINNTGFIVGPDCVILMGSAQGSIDALDVLRSFGAETVVPGHGKVTSPQVFDDIERYLQWLLDVAAKAITAGLSPLESGRAADLSEFESLTDNERLVGNLHRTMAEFLGPETNAAMSIPAAIADAIAYHGGPLLPCNA